MLLRRGANREAPNDSGKTPLYEACAGGQAEAASLLLDAGAKPNARDLFLETPLFIASAEGETAVVRVLLRHGGVEVDAFNDEQRTALHDAASYGHSDVVELLLAAGANPHCVNAAGKTAYDLTQTPRCATMLMYAMDHTAPPREQPPPAEAPEAPHAPPVPKRPQQPPPPPPPPPRREEAPPPPPPPPPPKPAAKPAAAAPAAAVGGEDAFERIMRKEIDALACAIAALEAGEGQRGAARKLRKRFHPDAARDVTSLLPHRAGTYQRLSQHANAATERFLNGD